MGSRTDTRGARGARRRALVRRRRRLYPVGLLIVLAILISLNSGTSGPTHVSRAGARRSTPPARLRLVASLASWHLPAPVSVPVVVPDAGQLVVAGGLDSSDASSSTFVEFDPESGGVLGRGSLPQATHDAAGAFVGGRPVVFGGGQLTPTDRVQGIDGSAASLLGTLPAPRADLATATLGGTAYVLAGYDGNSPSTGVLATSDGQQFSRVASLPVGVRYATAAGLGSKLYVFGGQSLGRPTDLIQEVDPGSGKARVVGRLPSPIARASAFVLGGRVFIAGGLIAGAPSDRIWRFDPGTGAVHPAGSLPLPVADAGAAVVGGVAYLVGGHGPQPLDTVIRLDLERATPAGPPPIAFRGSRGGVFNGDMLIADRGNDRLLLVNSAKQILWRYPSSSAPPPPGGFYFPDDAFFVRGGSAILSNEEDNHTLVQIAFPSGQVIWKYGHARVPGSGPGYLNQPDDAYLLRNGQIAVADAKNCRIEIIGADGRPSSQIGTTGSCVHDPPRSLGYPNGDTPLADGNLLLSEIFGSYIDEITMGDRLVWSVHLPIAYPSDPQQLGPNLYLVADYTKPGGLFEFNRSGRILWSYRPRSGPRMLDHPSLAERLPNGLIAVNDDYRHRVVIIDPATRSIVWQYGRTDVAGRGRGELNTPDGFDLLTAGGHTPTHPTTG